MVLPLDATAQATCRPGGRTLPGKLSQATSMSQDRHGSHAKFWSERSPLRSSNA